LLQITVEQENATMVLSLVNGEVLAAEAAFDGLVVGAVTVEVQAEGFAPLVQFFAMEENTSAHLYLDLPGQLLHKVAAWRSGGAPKQVAFTPDGTELWVTQLVGDGVEAFDPRTGELLGSVSLPDGGSVEVIFNEAGTLAYVSQMETGSVYEIEVATREILRTLDGEGNWSKVMVLSSDEKTLWLSNWSSNDVSEIDLVTGEVRMRMRTVVTPRGLWVTPDNQRLYVAGFENGDIEMIDLVTRESTVIHRTGGAMRHLVGDDATGLLYASELGRDYVVVVDTATDEVEILAEVDNVPNTIDLSPDGRVLYVSSRGRNNPESYHLRGPEWGSIAVIDTATGAYLDAIIGGNQPTGLDVSPDGTMLAYSDFLDHRVTVYEIPSYEVLMAGNGGRWEAHLREIVK
jgi:DNA-binding beta-propeller fold protein YncE